MSEHLAPIEVVERLVGPPEFVSGEILGLHPKATYKWRHPSDGRGAGDIPSAPHMRAILEHSEANGLGLTAEHLIRGADLAEVEAILSARSAPAPAFSSRRHRMQRIEAAE